VDESKLYIVNVETFLDKKKESETKAISGEEWLEILGDLLDTKQFGIIVLDSAAELCPKAELEGGQSYSGIGVMARMMSKGLRTITAKLLPTNTGLVILNQYRMSPGKYGDPRVEATGEALKFYTALKIEISKSLDKDGDGVYGIQVKAKITKSKVSAPYGTASYYVEFGKGIQRIDEIIDLAIEHKIIKSATGHYSYNEEKLCHGFDKLKQLFIDNSEFATDVECKVLEKLKEI
jgi:recombination protein RecA